MKKTLIIVTLALFSLSTLVMPYANFDDVKSLQAVYHHCLIQDDDTDFVEFIAENFLSAGIGLEKEPEHHSSQPKQPGDANLLVQIQTGTLYQQPVTEITLEQPLVPATLVPVINSACTPQEYHPGIFHPPAIV
jgi:heat shock protein HspQ